LATNLGLPIGPATVLLRRAEMAGFLRRRGLKDFGVQDKSAERIVSVSRDGGPTIFLQGAPARSTDFRREVRPQVSVVHTTMGYTPEDRSWTKLSEGRQPRTDAMRPLRPQEGSSAHSGRREVVQHKLGFKDSEAMPCLLPSRTLFDAFQDTNRTGKLPTELSEGSMPLYFSMNRKFIEKFEHTRRNQASNRGLEALSAPPTKGPLASLGPQEDPMRSLRGSGGSDARPLTLLGEQKVYGDEDESAPEWQVMRSESRGFPYWYNRRTGESRWTAPETSIETVKQRKDPTGSDRSWFNFQTGYPGSEEPIRSQSMGMSMNSVLLDQRTRPDFQLEERESHRKVLQRRALRHNSLEERTSDRWLGSSFPPAGRATAEDKLMRLISDKAYEHSTERGAMREAFFKMDKEKSGNISTAEVTLVLEDWLGMKLNEEQLQAVLDKFNPRGDGKILFSHVVAALEDSGHPLGGDYGSPHVTEEGSRSRNARA